MQIPTRPWATLIEHYRDRPGAEAYPLAPMRNFVRFLAESPYAIGLFGYTSHYDLVLAQTAVVHEAQDRLRVGYADGLFRLEYSTTMSGQESRPGKCRQSPVEWTTTCLENQVRDTFARFIDRVGWFPGATESVLPGQDGGNLLHPSSRLIEPT